MVKIKDGFKTYWCDHFDIIKRNIAAEKGGVPLKTIKQSEVTPRIKIMWTALTIEEKKPYAERDNRFT